jgi:hypothetical protein
VRDRYSLAVGLLFAAIVAVAFLHTINGGDNQILGADQLPAHWALPEFAIPDVANHSGLDSNIAQDDCETAQIPCPSGSRRTAACQIHPEGFALRVCEYFGVPLVLSFWFSRGGNCVEQQDVVSKVYSRFVSRVNFISINVGDEPEAVSEIVLRRAWRMPSGYDRDGAVADLYHVGACPTFAYVYPGGTLQDASIGELTSAQLEVHVRALLRATRAAEGG